MKLYITKAELQESGACLEGYRTLLRGIEYDDAEEVRIPLDLIVDVLDANDASWALDALLRRNLIEPEQHKRILDKYSRLSGEFWEDDMLNALEGETRP